MTKSQCAAWPLSAFSCFVLLAWATVGYAQPLINLCDALKRYEYYDAEHRVVRMHGTVTKLYPGSKPGELDFELATPLCNIPVIVNVRSRDRCGIGSTITVTGGLDMEMGFLVATSGTWHTCVR